MTSEPTQPANVDLYEAASRTMYAKWGFVGETADRLALQWATDLGHRAAVDAAFAAGREAAAQALIDHANIHFPDPTNSAQRTARRWLITAARVAAGPITPEQAAAALADYGTSDALVLSGVTAGRYGDEDLGEPDISRDVVVPWHVIRGVVEVVAVNQP